MRWLGGLMLILTVVGWLACEIPFSESPTASERQPDCWRRTRHGWEQASWVGSAIPERRPALHPGVVGLLELLVSITALVAFPGPRCAETGMPTGPAPPWRQGAGCWRRGGKAARAKPREPALAGGAADA